MPYPTSQEHAIFFCKISCSDISWWLAAQHSMQHLETPIEAPDTHRECWKQEARKILAIKRQSQGVQRGACVTLERPAALWSPLLLLSVAVMKRFLSSTFTVISSREKPAQHKTKKLA